MIRALREPPADWFRSANRPAAQRHEALDGEGDALAELRCGEAHGAEADDVACAKRHLLAREGKRLGGVEAPGADGSGGMSCIVDRELGRPRREIAQVRSDVELGTELAR